MVAIPASRAAASAVRTFSSLGRVSGHVWLESGFGWMVYDLTTVAPGSLEHPSSSPGIRVVLPPCLAV